MQFLTMNERIEWLKIIFQWEWLMVELNSTTNVYDIKLNQIKTTNECM